MRSNIIELLIICLCATVHGSAALDLKGFDDSVLYHINWLGQMSYTQLETVRENSPEIRTVMGNPLEVYECAMPVATKESTTQREYTGPTPFELVSTLFTPSLCSYRIESYWTYEICHGHYIKQFHEEREGKTSKIQEYYLGKWNRAKTTGRIDQEALANTTGTDPTKLKKVLSMNLPYVEVEMTDGTVCDLNGKPRMTRILYVCYTNGKNEVFSLKETSSCNYEVIILTSVLCKHPKYKPEEQTVNVINCGAVYSFTPRKPRSLMAMDLESMKMQYQKLPDTENLKDIAVVNFKDGTLKMEILQADQLRSLLNDQILEELPTSTTGTGPGTGSPGTTMAPLTKPITKVTTTPDDTSPTTEFLAGRFCLTGGTGWWKYEFCYGRHVRQFHIDQNGETSVVLGRFNEAAHKKWIQENESKRPNHAVGKPQLTHIYLDGTVCEKTGKPRQTEVKLKCMENAISKSAVSLYLMEPSTCQYILGVESPLICDIIPKADADGLVPMPSQSERKPPLEGTRPADPKQSHSSDNESDEELFLGNAVVEDFEVHFDNN